MEEMVRSEVSDQSPYAYAMKKMHEFKDFMLDYLLMQYGLKSIASKTLDFILEVKTKSFLHIIFIENQIILHQG
jgi:hypothetical protein